MHPPPATGDPDKIPEPRPTPHSKPGDLWICGPNRVLCGDSRQADSYKRLLGGEQAHAVWTDPPYGVDYTGGTGMTIQNDGRDPDELYALLHAAFSSALPHTRPGAAWYVAGPANPISLAFCRVLSLLNIWHQTIIWVKDRFVLGRGDFHYRHEQIFYGWTPGAAHRMPKDRSIDSLWHFDRPAASGDHPTMKPVALVARGIEVSTLNGELVLDPFGGSGTTLAAAHLTGRRAALIEIDPVYTDVVVERWFQLTGEPAIHADTGEIHPATATP